MLLTRLGIAEIKGKDEISKANQEYQDKIRAAFESIARLGRAARVFLFVRLKDHHPDVILCKFHENMSNKLAVGLLSNALKC